MTEPVDKSEVKSKLGDITKAHNVSTFSNRSGRSRTNDIESQKRRSIKKILMMSSMDKNIMKILLKIHEKGLNEFTKKAKQELEQTGELILDSLRLQELKALLEQLVRDFREQESNDVNSQTELQSRSAYNFKTLDEPYLVRSDIFMQILKFFVLSPVEQKYIERIETELIRTENIETRIKQIQQSIDKVKDEKLAKFKAEKKIWNPDTNKTCDKLLREISANENQLEKQNKKLNSITSQNNCLRERINVLRKEKNTINEILANLNTELAEKKKMVEKTIDTAGKAYYNRNRAEEELKKLQEKAEEQKIKFEQECLSINQDISKAKRFKHFIKSKQKEKEILEKLQEQIVKNEIIIEEKIKSNQLIEQEYQLSEKKECEIKAAFERIKKETGINKDKDSESQELLTVFINLFQKNTIMNKFVEELNKEVDQLDNTIEEKKKEIQNFNTKGATTDNKRREIKIKLTTKVQQEEKKKMTLKSQYEKSIETINLIKEYLEKVFMAINIDCDIIEKLKTSAITEENMVYFLGILEQKGLESIQEYSRLIAEQLKQEKDGDKLGLMQQVEDLNNIIAYENANIMAYYSNSTSVRADVPMEYLDEAEDFGSKEPTQFLTQDEFRKQSIEALNRKFMDKKQPGKNLQNSKVIEKAPRNQNKAQNKSFKKDVLKLNKD